MLKKIFIVLAVVVAVFVAIVAMQPSEFRIERTATISAPAAAAFAQINDFHKWEAWSPWEKLDPAMKKSFEGASAGTGAIYTWSGNDEVGEGRMTLTESRPNELIRIKLEFLKPFAATNTAEFTFKPEGNQTVVTWSMFGQNNFMSKAFGLFVNMEKMIGGDFEKGLAQLKAVAEAAPKKDLTITRIFDAPLERVWKAWTDPEQVKHWWGPNGFTSPSCEIDFREGGKFVFCMRAPKEMGGNDLYTAGVYKKIVPMERIEFTQALSDKDGNKINATTIGMPADFPEEIPSALTFKRVGDKTELTAIEYGWAVGQMRDLSEQGLSECLDKLAESLK